MPQTIKDREIFAVGSWRPSSGGTVKVDTAMLDRMADNYRVLSSKIPGFQIPLKLGHSSVVGDPAWGWVENVRRSGNKLVGDFVNLPDQLFDMIKDRRYNSVSSEIFVALPHEGTVYKDVLRAVAILGSEWPAVKGLTPLSVGMFAAEGAEVIEFLEREKMEYTQEQVDALVAAAVATATQESNRRADTAEAALSAFRDETAMAQINTLIEAAAKAGQIVPAQEPTVRNMVKAFTGKLHDKIKFGNKEQTPIEMLTEFIGALPKRVDFKEIGAGGTEKVGDGESAAIAVDRKVKEKMAATPKMSYREALDAVFAADPDLKTSYAEEA